MRTPLESKCNSEFCSYIGTELELHSGLGAFYHLIILGAYNCVRHSVGEYVDGMAHTNGIESFWSILKLPGVGILTRALRLDLLKRDALVGPFQ